MNLNTGQSNALDLVKKGKNLFITAPAGYGKSFLINCIKEYAIVSEYNVAVTALTGTASVIIKGLSLHSYLGIGLANESPQRLFEKCKYKYKKIYHYLNLLNILIIDEISMMNEELFDKIDDYLKYIRNSNKPFGGIQIILIGDFAQLPPVEGNYCFLSKKWTTSNIEIIQLTENMRQSDIEFQELLQEIRFSDRYCSDKTINILNELKNTVFDNNIVPTKIFSVNKYVNAINNDEFNKISKNNTIKIYKTVSTYKKSLKTLNIEDEIKLCIGCNIILTYNLDFDIGLVNGSRGICIALNDKDVLVQFINGIKMNIPYVKHYPDENNKKEYISYIPLILGYAISIHKSQGMTLDAIEINFDNIFEDGQAYVVLSRAKNLKSIKITNKYIYRGIFKSNEQVREFYEKLSLIS